MDIYHDPEGGFNKPRMHPYVAIRPGEAGFVDLKLNPDRIEQVLEDFRPHSHEPAIQAFYAFLRWLNGSDSILESCDCALLGPEANEADYSSRALCVHGRLMLMYRAPRANCDNERADQLYETLTNELSAVDPEFTRNDGAVGIAQSPMLYRELTVATPDEAGWIRPSHLDPGRGLHLMLLFRAFGDDREQAFKHLARTFRNIEHACRRTSEALK